MLFCRLSAYNTLKFPKENKMLRNNNENLRDCVKYLMNKKKRKNIFLYRKFRKSNKFLKQSSLQDTNSR